MESTVESEPKTEQTQPQDGNQQEADVYKFMWRSLEEGITGAGDVRYLSQTSEDQLINAGQ